MSEIHGAVGSYVINALDADELDEFETHLTGCPTCSREVVEFCETAAQLSLLAKHTSPPPALRGSILAQIREVRPLPPERSAKSGPAIDDGALRPVVSDELELRRQRRRTRLLTLVVAAVSVLALSLGMGVINLLQNQQAQVSETQLETQLFSAPDVKVSATKTVNGAQVSFVSSKSLNKALFVSSNLPSPGERLKYQLWTLQGRNAHPDALLDGGSRTQWFTGSVADATGLAVTIEPESGSAQPTTKAQAAAAI